MKSKQKKQVFLTLGSILKPKGFVRDGNYFRRHINGVQQALYLQPSKWGGQYYPEMLISFDELNSQRSNSMNLRCENDYHLSARLSSYYHPLGDPQSHTHWSIEYDQPELDFMESLEVLPTAMEYFLGWLDKFKTVKETEDKMRIYSESIYVTGYLLFEDLGIPVPMPK